MSARVPQWRAVALLAPWFAAGWSVMGLLHALDHHPDRPDVSRGDAARAARDPLRIVGHRLSPWRGRLGDVPASLTAVDGQVRQAHVAMTAEADVATGHRSHREVATATVRAAALAEVSRILTRRGR